MNSIQKTIVLNLALALSLTLINAEVARAQTTPQTIQGTWVTTGGGGFSRMILQFNADGTYAMSYADMSGRTVNDSGRFTILGGTVSITGNSGERAHVFFFWATPNAATIRVVPQGSEGAVEQPFVRVR